MRRRGDAHPLHRCPAPCPAHAASTQVARIGSALNSRSGDFYSRSDRKHSYSNPHGIFVNASRDDFVSNKRSITCVKEKNVMQHEKTIFQVVRSENLERVVAVSLEEMLVMIRNSRQMVASRLPQNAQGAVPLRNECCY